MRAMLTVELHDADPQKYQPFEDKLEELKWTKILRMTWRCIF